MADLRTHESRPQAAPENIAVAARSTTNCKVTDFLEGKIHAHELPWDIWLVWSDGFRAGQERMQPRLDQANRDADYWYVASKHSPQKIAELQFEASRTGGRIDWHRGEVVAE